jgi:aminomethyltransferase
LLNEDGCILDDLMVARVGLNDFMLVVNASNLDSDRAWIQSNLPADVNLMDNTASTIMLAIQGPESERIFRQVVGDAMDSTRFLDVRGEIFEGEGFLCSRSGYTGEDGFELVTTPETGHILWERLCQAGATPCGLGARDLLRLEMGYPLYGHELSRTVRPQDCNLLWTVSRKNVFLGIQGMMSHIPQTELIGFVCQDKAVPREGYDIEVKGAVVGNVTSGGLSNRLPSGFGIGRVLLGSVRDQMTIHIRGRKVAASLTPMPFVTPRTRKNNQ